MLPFSTWFSPLDNEPEMRSCWAAKLRLEKTLAIRRASDNALRIRMETPGRSDACCVLTYNHIIPLRSRLLPRRLYGRRKVNNYSAEIRALSAGTGRSAPKTRSLPGCRRIYCDCRRVPAIQHAATERRQIPPRLHRLDAWTGLPAPVPDPLLRFLAESAGAAEPLFHVLAAGRNLSGSSVSVAGWNFLCDGHRKALAERRRAGPDCPRDHPPRRRDLHLRPALPPAGVRHLLGLGAENRSAARGRAEHHRPLDDAAGSALLAGARARSPAAKR